MNSKPGDEQDDTRVDSVDVEGTVSLPAKFPADSDDGLGTQAEATVNTSDPHAVDATHVDFGGASSANATRADEDDGLSTQQMSSLPESGLDQNAVDGTMVQSSPSGETRNDAEAFSVDEAVEGTIMTGGQAGSRAPSKGEPESDPPDGHVRRIGRYEVQSMLGEGAFGQVLRCRDPQLDRIVAVKIAKSNVMMDPRKVERFLREAKSAALLRHPNIIPVFEYGTVDQTHFIAYQFIEGRTLARWFELHQSQPLEQRIELIAKLADALDYAHECGIVHRDIKPDNILVDHEDTPHIADFGCARMESSDVNQTVDGALMGTPAYMSPEQASGKSREADGRSDLWSVGVILYEQLCGRRPFEGKLADLIYQITTQDPPPPSKFRTSLPRDLVTICMKCLARDPQQRFSRCSELAAELRRWMRGEPIQSRPVPPWVRTWMWAKRNPTVATLSALFVAALLVGTIVSTTFAIQANRRQNALVRSQLDSLLVADSASVPLILDNLKTVGRGVPAALQKMQATPGLAGTQRLRLSLARAFIEGESGPEFEQQVRAMGEGLVSASPAELSMALPLIRPFAAGQLTAWFWERAASLDEPADRRLRASAALAQLDPEARRWNEIEQDVLALVMREPAESLEDWAQLLGPKASSWQSDLEALMGSSEDALRQQQAALLLAYLYDGEVPYLVELAEQGNAGQLRVLLPFLNRHPQDVLNLVSTDSESSSDEAKALGRAIPIRVNRALIACALGDSSPLTALWLDVADPTARTEAIHRFGPAGLSAELLTPWLTAHASTDPHIVSAVLATLVDASERDLKTTARGALAPTLIDIFKTNSDSGVHSAAAWVLTQWGQVDALVAARLEIQSELPRPGMNWHEDPTGITFAVFGPLESFSMGDPDLDQEGVAAPVFHRCSIPRRVGIATTEVTVGSFQAFEQAIVESARQELETLDRDSEAYAQRERVIQRFQRAIANRQLGDNPRVPVTNVTWMEAAAYCNWLSRQSGLDAQQRAFPGEAETLEFEEHAPAELARAGYRLPTAAEWEYACRAGSQTRYYVGRTPDWLSQFEWTIENSGESLHPVGQLKPNGLGLFDSHGNAAEWCNDYPLVVPAGAGQVLVDGQPGESSPDDREIRGGSYRDEFGRVAAFSRDLDFPDSGYAWRGFRLARTYP